MGSTGKLKKASGKTAMCTIYIRRIWDWGLITGGVI